MRKYLYLFALLPFITISMELSAQKVYAPISTPEEQQLSVTFIQEIGGFCNISKETFSGDWFASCKSASISWKPLDKEFAVSPDGKCYALISSTGFIKLYNADPTIPYEEITIEQNGRRIVTNRKSLPFEYPHFIVGKAETFTWGTDNKLYVESEEGVFSVTIGEKPLAQKIQVTQIGSPVYCQANNTLYCNRNGSIYEHNIKDRTELKLFEGSTLTVAGEYLYYMRGIDEHSEIWRRNVMTGKEEKILSSVDHAFANPSISPDGKWIICEGNAISPLSKKQNLDIFIAKTDGSNLKQITNHPANDIYPVWQKDGKHIYFMSLRGTKYNKKYANYSLFSMDISSFMK